MNIYISPFVLGVICTIVCEILAFFLLIFFIAIKNSLKSHRNTSNSSRRDKNE